MPRRPCPRLAAALVALALLAPSSRAGAGERQSWEAQVTDVLDGDTIDVLYHDEHVRIRFFGMDAPEKAMESGPESKAFMTELLMGKIVTVEVMDADMHGRTVGIVHVGDVVANEESLRNGWAWAYRDYCKTDDPCKRYFALEDEARDAGRGLWKADNPIPPWEWRTIFRTVEPYVPPKPRHHRDGPAPDKPAPKDTPKRHGHGG